MNLNIYQYRVTGTAREAQGVTRWIAARDEAAADAAAVGKGWEEAGGLVFASHQLKHCKTPRELKTFGVDVVVA